MTGVWELLTHPGLTAVLLGYLFGSLPSAYWLGKFVYHINIFDFGSRNMGATNVHRVLGKGPFAITLSLDILKGLSAVLLAARLSPGPEAVFSLKILAAAGAMIGHSLSFWVNFRGGKGVATGLGVFLALAPVSSVLAMFVFLVVLVPTGWVSLGSIIASGALPVMIWFFQEGGPDWCPWLTGFATLVALFIIYRHKANISRLLRGEENSLKNSPGKPTGRGA